MLISNDICVTKDLMAQSAATLADPESGGSESDSEPPLLGNFDEPGEDRPASVAPLFAERFHFHIHLSHQILKHNFRDLIIFVPS